MAAWPFLEQPKQAIEELVGVLCVSNRKKIPMGGRVSEGTKKPLQWLSGVEKTSAFPVNIHGFLAPVVPS